MAKLMVEGIDSQTITRVMSQKQLTKYLSHNLGKMPNWKFTVMVKLAYYYFLTTYEVRIASIFTLFAIRNC